MNGCEAIRAHLDDWLDDALGQADRDRVAAHLQDCRDCEAFFARHRSIATDLAALGGAADRMAALPVTPRRRPSSTARVLLRIAAGVALMTTVGLLVVSYFDDSQRDAQRFVQDDFPRDSEVPTIEVSRFHSTHEAGRIVVPIACDNPKVHIVWLYNTAERDVPLGDEEENGEKPV